MQPEDSRNGTMRTRDSNEITKRLNRTTASDSQFRANLKSKPMWSLKRATFRCEPNVHKKPLSIKGGLLAKASPKGNIQKFKLSPLTTCTRNKTFYETPSWNYDYQATKFLLWTNITKKAEEIRADALNGKYISKSKQGSRIDVNSTRRFQSQTNVAADMKFGTQKHERLLQYAERLEQERGKNYDDGAGAYQDNITDKFADFMPEVVSNFPVRELPKDCFEGDIDKCDIARVLDESGTNNRVRPFDLYRVFQYAHNAEGRKPVELRPLYKAYGKDDLVAGARAELQKIDNRIMLLNTIRDCYMGKSEEKQPKTLSRSIDSLKNLAKNTNYEDELGYFISNYLTTETNERKTRHNKWYIPSERRFKCLDNLKTVAEMKVRLKDNTQNYFLPPYLRSSSSMNTLKNIIRAHPHVKF